jgi:hypothetical protein
MMDDALRAQLRQTVYIAPLVAPVSSHGQPTPGTQVAHAARVEPSRRIVTSASGEDVQTSHRVIIEGVAVLESLIWLPGTTISDRKQARRLASVATFTDENGAHDHSEILI